MSEQTPEHAEVERGGMDEQSDAPLTETEVETSKKPEDRDSDV
ncbi:hypothetical protein ACI784_02035 [Geodermatophilus sp. SYSU D01186]